MPCARMPIPAKDRPLPQAPTTQRRVEYGTCYMCACHCGIQVTLEDGELRFIQGTRDHLVNQGVLWAKGSAGIMQQHSRAKLRKPLLRNPDSPRGRGEFREIEWDQALAIVEERLANIRATDPPRLAFFTGRDQMQAPTGLCAQQSGTLNWAAQGAFCSVNMAAAGLYSRRVPLAFWLLRHTSGALLIVVLDSISGDRSVGWIRCSAALFALSLIVKLEYWGFVAGRRRSVTLEQALGVGHGVAPPRKPGGVHTVAARLLDVGHAKGTFLTRGFLHLASAPMRWSPRATAVVAGFVVPIAWLLAGDRAWALGVVAFLACIAGLIAERWLFFAEARHAVGLYHGDART